MFNCSSGFLASFFLLSVSGGVIADMPTDPCVDDGYCWFMEFERPPLPAVGDPANAQYNGEAWAYEEDSGGASDDGLGEADNADYDDPHTPENESAENQGVNICNDGGDLARGVNGEPQNGGLEGDCIEVYIRWTYTYTAWEAEQVNDGKWVIVEVLRKGYKSAPAREICPC